MIKLDVSVALFLYLFFTVVVTFVLWIWMERGSKLNAFKVEPRDVWQCSICSYVYVDAKKEDFSRCPRCKSINQKEVHGL